MMEEPRQRKARPGAPMYMTTFADLMALLMCFFVLLLSFSEMDLQKYKQVAGSMAAAFGVQREIVLDKSPMGTSYVAREFSPGKPDPTVVKTLQQKSQRERPHLERPRSSQRAKRTAETIKAGLKEEVRKGLVSVETREDNVIIRIQEKGSFPSGSDHLMSAFRPTVAKIGKVLEGVPGNIVVSGHTDDVPIASGRFRSNWELSSARAVTVVHTLLATAELAEDRFRIAGYGEIKPLAPNDSAANRALNRRVELVIEPEPGDGQRERRPISVTDGETEEQAP